MSRSTAAALLLGIGMGGFVDGIVLHQIQQWHNMLSAWRPPETMEAMRLNMAADGWFHLAMWLVTGCGIVLLWHAPERHAVDRALADNLLVGWGLFNVVEGLVDHHALQLHHVRDLPMHMPGYDVAFLAIAGSGFIVVGVLLRPKPQVAVR